MINQFRYFLVAGDQISSQNLNYITLRNIPNKRIINLPSKFARDFIVKGIGSEIISDTIKELILRFKYELIHAEIRAENKSLNKLLVENESQLTKKENSILFKSNQDFELNFYEQKQEFVRNYRGD
jgi:hypothetical protein